MSKVVQRKNNKTRRKPYNKSIGGHTGMKIQTHGAHGCPWHKMPRELVERQKDMALRGNSHVNSHPLRRNHFLHVFLSHVSRPNGSSKTNGLTACFAQAARGGRPGPVRRGWWFSHSKVRRGGRMRAVDHVFVLAVGRWISRSPSSWMSHGSKRTKTTGSNR